MKLNKLLNIQCTYITYFAVIINYIKFIVITSKEALSCDSWWLTMHVYFWVSVKFIQSDGFIQFYLRGDCARIPCGKQHFRTILCLISNIQIIRENQWWSLYPQIVLLIILQLITTQTELNYMDVYRPYLHSYMYMLPFNRPATEYFNVTSQVFIFSGKNIANSWEEETFR